MRASRSLSGKDRWRPLAGLALGVRQSLKSHAQAFTCAPVTPRIFAASATLRFIKRVSQGLWRHGDIAFRAVDQTQGAISAAAAPVQASVALGAIVLQGRWLVAEVTDPRAVVESLQALHGGP